VRGIKNPQKNKEETKKTGRSEETARVIIKFDIVVLSLEGLMHLVNALINTTPCPEKGVTIFCR